jgi:hypothetical protein
VKKYKNSNIYALMFIPQAILLAMYILTLDEVMARITSAAADAARFIFVDIAHPLMTAYADGIGWLILCWGIAWASAAIYASDSGAYRKIVQKKFLGHIAQDVFEAVQRDCRAVRRIYWISLVALVIIIISFILTIIAGVAAESKFEPDVSVTAILGFIIMGGTILGCSDWENLEPACFFHNALGFPNVEFTVPTAYGWLRAMETPALNNELIRSLVHKRIDNQKKDPDWCVEFEKYEWDQKATT